MADAKAQAGAAKGPAEAAPKAGEVKPSPMVLPPRERPTFKHAWPIPALILALGLFTTGLVVAVSKRPKPDPKPVLVQAQALVESQKYDEAIAFLNKEVVPFVTGGQLAPEQLQEFYLMQARSFAGAQSALGVDRAENHRTIVEAYERAEKLGAKVTPADVSSLVASHLSLGRVEDAIERAHSLGKDEESRKTRLLKAIVEVALARKGGGGKGEGLVLDVLNELSASSELSANDRAWVLARQAELLLARGAVEEAINKLIRRIGFLRDVENDQQAELYLLLGKAYYQSDQPANAAKQLEAAETLLPVASPLRAETGVMLARLAQGAGQFEAARDRYQAVLGELGASKVYAQAILGLAESHSALRESESDQEQGRERYAELVELVKGGRGAGSAGSGEHGESHGSGIVGEESAQGVTREDVSASLMERFRERYDAGKRERALPYAELAESLFKDSDVPAAVLLGIGQTHRDLGDALVEQAKVGKDADFGIADMESTARAAVKQHYLAAGDYLLRHAQAVASTDLGAYSSSLWQAADSFDLAGDLDQAKKVFEQYTDGAPENDPQRAAAKFRLAQVLQARKDFVSARGLYASLVEGRAKPNGLGEAGVWSERSIVPMAQCLLSDGDPSNDAEAEKLLVDAVEGNQFTPEAAGYRGALIELGGVYYALGRYPEAIARLEQAVERYPDERRADVLRFRLADSHRLEAGRIRMTLEQALPQSQRDELERSRVQHLRSSRALFEQARASLSAKDVKKLSALEKTCLRNAYFYAGDCSFELKEYETAIASYDTARLRYADDPASLVAMAQIVSAYMAQNRWAEARTANERARQQLARFPEDVWSRADLPMEKKHWERWLDARTQLEQMAQMKDDGR